MAPWGSGLFGKLASGRERARFLETVLDAAPVAMVLLDDAGTIVFTNSGARELFFQGGAPEGQNFLALLATAPGPLREALLSQADHLFTFDSGGESETYHLAKRHVDLGSEPYTLLIVRHMTLELSRQHNAVLRKAIRVIHHELANSLTPVLSLLQTARGKVGKPEMAAKLGQLLEVVQDRMARLKGFLTGFAALGSLPRPRPETVGWEPFLTGLRPLLGDIALAPPPAGAGWFDPAQIQQVIINLVKNAREGGSPPAEIRLEVLAAPDGGHRVSVLDRGAGMSDETLENAFVPSFTTRPDGSGMGLALCREIIDAHRGRLDLGRRDGGGTVVTFWLPPRLPVPGAAGGSRARLSLTRP
jgi:signal transduction histidine kinase